MTEAYPLQWPPGWKRTTRPERARFGEHTRAKAVREVLNELQRLGASRVIISTNLELRLDGLPRSGQRAPQDQGVAVYFHLEGQQQCFPCDRWDKIEHNLWAIAKSIEALRGLDRWGAKDMVNAAFRGFKALPPPDGTPGAITLGIQERAWWEVLGVSQDAPGQVVEAAYKALLKTHHPDVGGDVAKFHELQRAMNQYRERK